MGIFARFATATIMLFSCISVASAACPKSLVGTYTFSDIYYEGDGSVTTGIGVLAVSSNTSATITYQKYSKSGDNGFAPAKSDNARSIILTFNQKNCTGTVTVDNGDGPETAPFVVTNNGSTWHVLNSLKNSNSSYASGTVVVTKQ
jgi:hypothetical protein